MKRPPGWAILDSNVYIDHWQGRLGADALRFLRAAFVVRHSAVVMSELRRGARTLEARRLVEALHAAMTVCWEPSRSEWWEAGDLVRQIGDQHGWDVAKRRDFQNDVLIALTASSRGAAVVTTDRADFELIATRVPLQVIVPATG